MWITLFKKYWQVALFKETPDNTPYSPLFLCIIAIFYFSLVFVQWLLVDIENQFTLLGTLFAAIALVLSYALYTFALLYAYKLANRTVQTLTCLLVCHTIVHLLALPLIIIVPLLTTGNFPQLIGILIGVMYLLAVLLLTIWQFMLSAYIYKQALSIDYLGAAMASFGLLATNILIVSLWR